MLDVRRCVTPLGARRPSVLDICQCLISDPRGSRVQPSSAERSHMCSLNPLIDARRTHGAIERFRAVVRVEEEQLLVGSKCPHARRDDLLSVIADGAHLGHGFEAKDTSGMSTGSALLCLLHFMQRLFECRDCSTQLVRFSGDAHALGLDGRGQHMLLDHVNHTESLHLNDVAVLPVHDRLSALGLRLIHDGAAILVLEIGEERDALRGTERADGVYGRGVVGNAAPRRLDGPFGAIAVTVEDDCPMLIQRGLGHVACALAGLDLGAHFRELGGQHGAQHRVHHGDVLGRADGAELEAVTTIREGRRAVAVLGRHRHLRDGADTKREVFRGGGVRRLRLAFAEFVKVCRERVTEVG
mmetsp:Transcript_50179/g.99941  ORF Transcript_50179/g.99941 Transcript_50179/m.99941 type:complete len:356 (+) Transcript_50179:355-1422(+)